MANTGWNVNPEQVQSVLSDVEEERGELYEKLSGSTLEDIDGNLDWTPEINGPVYAAMGLLLQDQQENLENITNRIEAGILGVANATVSYANGQTDMAGEFNTQLVGAAESGDFAYLEENNQLEFEDQA
ncbi:hypothetical protein HGQ17_08215 [Nesterenkonia sp. MY13]|uniref:WXG100 family type VII secretion target n=1 Tax=Nesterenkonia sedimenti TaxID=1463632 RepID=A0A7X8TJL8_9MICC|nr:DUF6507 family protein [Nesterenkonia sedimenti]NLS09981.1 hypothetical protein [Nesterenkonia sedimenti]